MSCKFKDIPPFISPTAFGEILFNRWYICSISGEKSSIAREMCSNVYRVISGVSLCSTIHAKITNYSDDKFLGFCGKVNFI